jgi:hypothetical protein
VIPVSIRALQRGRDALANNRQMVRDLSHALAAAVSYTMNTLW